MKLYIIRHGESLDDVEDRFGGFANYSLTENGLAKVNRLAESLKDSGIQKVFTSPYTRAYDAAKLISEACEALLEIDIDIRERNTYGFLSGMRKEIAKEMFPQDCEKSKNQKTADDIDGSEKYEEVVVRAKRFLEMLKMLDFETVAMVTHGKFTDIFQREILKLGTIYKPSDCGYIVMDLDTKEILEAVNARIVVRFNR